MLAAIINLTPISVSDTGLSITIRKSSLIACHNCFHLAFSVPTLCNLQSCFLSVATSSHFPFYLILSHWEQKLLNLLNPSQFNFGMAAVLWAAAKQDSRQDPEIMGTPRRFSNLAVAPGLAGTDAWILSGALQWLKTGPQASTARWKLSLPKWGTR